MYDYFKLTEIQRIISPSRAAMRRLLWALWGKWPGDTKTELYFFPLIYTIYAILHLINPVLKILALWLLKNSAKHDITVTPVVKHAVTLSKKVSVWSNILGVTESREVGCWALHLCKLFTEYVSPHLVSFASDFSDFYSPRARPWGYKFLQYD